MGAKGQFEQAEKTEPKNGPLSVADWRYKECLRILGPDGHTYALAFSVSRIDLHRLEAYVQAGATPKQLADWLL